MVIDLALPTPEYKVLAVNGIPIPLDTVRITVDEAKTLLGWETEADLFNRIKESNPKVIKDKCAFGHDFLMRDANANKVRCWNNSRNRPFSEAWCRMLAQDILNRHWHMNCETIIISKTGLVLSGQHRLIALVLAYQEWSGRNSMRWANKWPEEPYIEALVVTGADEDQDTINTLDNVRSRSLSDVFYTSPMFASMEKDQRKKASDMLQKSVEFLWKRVVKAHRAYSSDKIQYDELTHSRAVEFKDNHTSILDFVKMMVDLDDEGPISKLMRVGPCGAIAYLQASSDSDADSYRAAETPSEQALDWNKKAKAERFWDELAKGTALFAPIRTAIAAMANPDTEEDPKLLDKICMLAKAWALFSEDMHMSADPDDEEHCIIPRTREDDYGNRILVEFPTFGGIDYGEPGKSSEAAAVDSDAEENNPSPEEIAAETERIRAGKKFKGKVEAHNNQAKSGIK